MIIAANQGVIQAIKQKQKAKWVLPTHRTIPLCCPNSQGKLYSHTAPSLFLLNVAIRIRRYNDRICMAKVTETETCSTQLERHNSKLSVNRCNLKIIPETDTLLTLSASPRKAWIGFLGAGAGMEAGGVCRGRSREAGRRGSRTPPSHLT